ncbi:MAG: hypothetical protein WCR55_12755 [Lentisphaerota bacterium]
MKLPITYREILNAPHLTSWTFKFTKEFVDQKPELKDLIEKKDWEALSNVALHHVDDEELEFSPEFINSFCEIWTDAKGRILHYSNNDGISENG